VVPALSRTGLACPERFGERDSGLGRRVTERCVAEDLGSRLEGSGDRALRF